MLDPRSCRCNSCPLTIGEEIALSAEGGHFANWENWRKSSSMWSVSVERTCKLWREEGGKGNRKLLFILLSEHHGIWSVWHLSSLRDRGPHNSESEGHQETPIPVSLPPESFLGIPDYIKPIYCIIKITAPLSFIVLIFLTGSWIRSHFPLYSQHPEGYSTQEALCLPLKWQIYYMLFEGAYEGDFFKKSNPMTLFLKTDDRNQLQMY